MNEKSNMYEFVGRTTNPLGGECAHKCTYCYVERLKDRFPAMKKKYSGDPYLVKSWVAPYSKEVDIVFVESCGDLFAANVPDDIIENILKRLADEKGTLLFQTKNPVRYSDFLHLIPEGSILVTTIESRNWHEQMGNAPFPEQRADDFANVITKIHSRQVTIEPIMDFFSVDRFVSLIKFIDPDQVNIGADSGRNNLPEPSSEKIRALIAELEKFTTVVKKKNLKRLLPDG